MSGAALPPVIPEPFAQNADPAFIQNPIPQTTGASGRASYDQGFPAITMQPVAAGGKPPFGQDFNGLFFALTSQQYFAQAGQLWPYNADVVAAIGGYAVGTVLSSLDGITVWMNTVNANTTNPDDAATAAGWVSLFTYGYTILTLTGGSRTLVPGESRAPVVIINGTLISNLAIVLPRQLRQWLIVNNTAGAFNMTVRGAAGTGVTIPQGGFNNPVGVYSDGTNFYPTIPAASLIPASQSWDPATLAERDNLGRLLATDFVTNSTPNNFGVVNTFYDDGDGTIRKIALATFEATLALSAIGGAVTPGQVPSAAVTQYAATILASAPLTGTPTAPTAAVGTSSTQVATTAFANPSQNLTAAKGHAQLPGGLILNWEQVSVANGTGAPIDIAVTFDTPFTTFIGANVTTKRSVAGQGQAVDGSGFYSSPTGAGMNITLDTSGGGLSQGFYWAIGK